MSVEREDGAVNWRQATQRTDMVETVPVSAEQSTQNAETTRDHNHIFIFISIGSWPNLTFQRRPSTVQYSTAQYTSTAGIVIGFQRNVKSSNSTNHTQKTTTHKTVRNTT
jgi:hypothetical protein